MQNSNIVQLVSCLKKDNQNQQLVYYQPGIGTYTSSVFYSPITQQASKFLDLMIAWNLSKHVQGEPRLCALRVNKLMPFVQADMNI